MVTLTAKHKELLTHLNPNLEVVQYTKHYRAISVVLKCKRCSKTRIRTISKSNLQRECTCTHPGNVLNNQSRSWKGIGALSHTTFNRNFYRAKYKQREFTVSIEYCWCLYLEQQCYCNICGSVILFAEKYHERYNHLEPSLDRIDSYKGYIENNLQWLCKTCQKMKSNLSQDIFIQQCQKITKYNQ